MYRKCTTVKTENQQRKLEQTLFEVLQTTPYPDISVVSLFEKAGLTRKIFYRLFGCKDDVLYALIDHTLMDYTAAACTDGNRQEKVWMEQKRVFSFWYENRELLDVLERNHMSNILVERSIQHVLSEQIPISRLFGTTGLIPESDAYYYLIFFVRGIMEIVFHWHRTNYEKSIEEMTQIMLRLMPNFPASSYENDAAI